MSRCVLFAMIIRYKDRCDILYRMKEKDAVSQLLNSKWTTSAYRKHVSHAKVR